MEVRADIDAQTAWSAFEPSKERPWSLPLAAHLHRRSGFGGTAKEIETSYETGFEKSIDRLFEQIVDPSIEDDLSKVGRLVSSGSQSRGLASWWLLRMAKTKAPFLEKMTLFWHGHFATGAEKVKDSRAMLRQNQVLRKHALGKFSSLVKAISKDVAMLIYLDSEENRKTRPNENYARELMELFCLGPGHYSEKDIKEIARCFTGWEIRKKSFRFNEHQHDTKTKSFLGSTGKFDGNDAIEIVLKQEASANFVARKLVRFFVSDELILKDQLIAPLAKQLRETEFDIEKCVRRILSSKLFFSQLAIGKKIKSPVELAIGFLRFFEASTNMNQLQQNLFELGQLPFYPPNVKGWAGGKSWINASSILARGNLINGILRNNKTKFKAGDFSKAISRSRLDGKDLLKNFETFMLASTLDPAKRIELEKLLLNTQSDPKEMFSWLASVPEFQLN